MSLARFIASQKAVYRVPYAVSCRALGVSQSWFFKWHDRPPTPAAQRRTEVDEAVAAEFKDSGGSYGSPRIHAELTGKGWRVSEKTVAKSMARQHLAARVKKRTYSEIVWLGADWTAPTWANANRTTGSYSA